MKINNKKVLLLVATCFALSACNQEFVDCMDAENSLDACAQHLTEAQLQGIDEGGMPQGIDEGGRPQGIDEGGRPQGIDEGGRPQGIDEGGKPQGIDEGGSQ